MNMDVKQTNLVCAFSAIRHFEGMQGRTEIPPRYNMRTRSGLPASR